MALGGRSGRGSLRRRKRVSFKKKRTMCCTTKRIKRRKPAWKKRAIAGMSTTPSANNVCKVFRAGGVDPTVLATRALYFTTINQVPNFDVLNSTYGIGANMRLRNIVNLRGWRLRLSMLNLYNIPLWFNFAIIGPKGSNPDEPAVADFFRDYGTSRDIGFGTGLSGVTMNFNPINPDKFHILMHKRFFLPVNTDATSDYSEGAYANTNYRYKKFWVPFKKPIAFDDDTATNTPETEIWMAYWCDQPMTPAGASSSASAAIVTMQAFGYFKEPK